VLIAITATNVPKLIQKVGYRPILMIAPLFVSAGLFWVSHIPVHGTFWGNVAPGMALFAVGMGATFVSITIAATSGVPQHESGLASGLLNTAQQIGGALGLAVLTGLATSSSSRYLTNLHLHAKPGADMIATATVHGFHDGYLVASTFGIGASLIAALVLRNQKQAPGEQPGEVAIV
jgi:MFS family permease